MVIDASAAVELVLQGPCADGVGERALRSGASLHAPHLIDVELAQALRRLALSRRIETARAELALGDFADLLIERHSHSPLRRRIWSLRSAMTAYDAAYVALAEALACPLITCDGRLARAGGHGARIELLARER
ncbi:MAG TPA: type II toxin-antitoxin system VapC family toxin [Steroidobacteraceae bacterium]|nr:type II toxin-antitoxin system VapC family toxin [Steroidobacteraceae bacterium]